MEAVEVVPDPISLLESMRAVGYSVEAAVADLIDNSIAANAKNVTIKYDATVSPFIAILDDGDGMDSSELTNAMRHGSSNPTLARMPSDLGRFGLGLKTASLSQCRRLTVVSKKNGSLNGMCWDIDFVKQTGRWLVLCPEIEELRSLPMCARLASNEKGTLVIWQNLDRLIAGASSPQTEMNIKLASLYDHLSLVFHRFAICEEGLEPVSIKINGLEIAERDPFLKRNCYRQPLERQIIKHEKGNVIVTPYILPPISHLSPSEIEVAGGREGLRNSQGFYVYRNRRLVVWGTWFQLIPKDEFNKLTRVQVDIPNTFDELWALDIKKSVAFPPDSIRNRLKELVPHFVDTSKNTITYQGRKQPGISFTPLWMRTEPRNGAFRYELCRQHLAIVAVEDAMPKEHKKDLHALLELLSESLPLESIYADMCSDDRIMDDAEKYRQLLEIAKKMMNLTGLSIEEIVNIDPLIRYPRLAEGIIMELRK